MPGGMTSTGASRSWLRYRLGTLGGGKFYEDCPDSPHRQSIWKAPRSHGHRDWKIYYSILWKKAVFTHQLYLKGQILEVDAAWAKAVLNASDGYDLPSSEWIAPLQQFYQDIKYNSLPRFSYLNRPGRARTAPPTIGLIVPGLASVVPGDAPSTTSTRH